MWGRLGREYDDIKDGRVDSMKNMIPQSAAGGKTL